MKRLFTLLLLIVPFAFCSCEKKQTPQDEQPEEQIYSVVGVWKDGDYVVSFSSDGYYCAYLDEYIINNGSYKQNGNKSITCEYTWRSAIPFGRDTSFDILEIGNEKMRVKAISKDISGDIFEKEYSFEKTVMAPSVKEHSLVEKSYSVLSTNGTVKYSLVTNDTGMMTNSYYPFDIIDFYYIYLADNIYFQTFFLIEPINTGAWTFGVGNGKVAKMSATNFMN